MGRLDNYEEVKDRLPRFWAKSKDGRIVTEIIDHSENWERVLYRASLFEGDTLIATGHAMDWKGKDNQANRTNWIEVAETSAIGRAIANSRYQDPNAERASREEMEVAIARQSALDVTKESSGLVELSTPNVTPAHQKPAWIQQFETRFSTKVNEERVTKYCVEKGQIKAGQRWRDLPMAAVQKLQKDNNKGLESLCRAAGVTL